MALRQLIACILCMFLLLAVAFAAAPSPAPPRDSVDRARESCYKTVKGVPRKCAGQFIRALFNGRTVETYPITTECCIKLACVREWSCMDVLRTVCLPGPGDGRLPAAGR